MSDARPYRYGYSQSQMQPPFWIVKDGRRAMCEVWTEKDAQDIVTALERRKITMSPELSSAEVHHSRDGDACFVDLTAGPRSVHKIDVSLYFADANRAAKVVDAIKGKFG